MPTPDFVICATADTARQIANMIRAGEAPRLYKTEREALDAWALYPDHMARHHVWKVVHVGGQYTRCDQLTDGETIRTS